MAKVVNKDILLEKATNDLSIVNFDLTLTTGADLTVQKIKQTLQLFLGEWFLNDTVGIPYFSEMLDKGKSLTRIQTLYIRALQTIPEILEILEFNINEDRAKRTLNIDFKVRDEEGNVLEIEI
jgi:hypothetical protein